MKSGDAEFKKTKKMKKPQVIRVHLKDMEKLINAVETAAWAVKAAILLMILWIISCVILGIQFPSPWLFLILGVSLVLLGANVTLWGTWALIKTHYNQWAAKELAQRAIED